MGKSIRSALLWYNLLLYLIFLSNFPLGIGLTLFEVFHLLPLAFVSKGKILPQTLFKIATALIVSILFWNRAAIDFQFAAILSVISLNYFIFYEIAHQEPYSNDNLIIFVKNLFSNFVNNITALFDPPKILPKLSGVNPNIRKIFYGVIISLPVLFILGSLFSSADATFESWFMEILNSLTRIVNLDFLQINPFSLLFTAFFFTWYILLLLPTEVNEELPFASKYVIEFITVTALVALTFCIFILTQYQNVQSILQGFSTGVLNPRDFVREGFYQMTFASGIAFLVLYLLEHNLRAKITEKVSRLGKTMAGILLTEIVIVVLLAFQRVWAYQFAYGFTQLRLWGIVLVVWLLIMAFLFAVKLYRSLAKAQYMQSIIIFSGLLILAVGWLNFDKIIATTNRPTVNGAVDYGYIGRLSYDAAGEWEKTLKTVEPNETELVIAILNQVNSDLNFPKTCEDKWFGFGYNTAVNRGKDIVCDNLDIWKNKLEQLI